MSVRVWMRVAPACARALLAQFLRMVKDYFQRKIKFANWIFVDQKRFYFKAIIRVNWKDR